MSTEMERILDICLQKVEKGIPVDEILKEYPEHREELKELLTLAKDIENAPLPRLGEEAVSSCLIKVHNALPLHKKPAWRTRLLKLQWPRFPYFPFPAWVKAFALVIIVIFVSWSTVSLSGNSIPGNLLYPVKLTTEKVKFYLTPDPEGKAELRLAYSEERMQELVRYLDKEGKLNGELVKAMLDESALVTDNISKLSKEKAAICCTKLKHLCKKHRDVLTGLRSRVPSFQRQELDNLIQECHNRMEWMDKVIMNEVPMGEWGPFAVSEI